MKQLISIGTYVWKTIAVAALLAASGGIASAATEWVPASGRSCANVCAAANAQAEFSGIYKNGKRLYVCSANAGGEGLRAGYNLEPNWSRSCTVGFGGKEVSVGDYMCLCVR